VVAGLPCFGSLSSGSVLFFGSPTFSIAELLPEQLASSGRWLAGVRTSRAESCIHEQSPILNPRQRVTCE